MARHLGRTPSTNGVTIAANRPCNNLASSPMCTPIGPVQTGIERSPQWTRPWRHAVTHKIAHEKSSYRAVACRRCRRAAAAACWPQAAVARTLRAAVDHRMLYGTHQRTSAAPCTTTPLAIRPGTAVDTLVCSGLFATTTVYPLHNLADVPPDDHGAFCRFVFGR